jgi:hypothetical protein
MIQLRLTLTSLFLLMAAAFNSSCSHSSSTDADEITAEQCNTKECIAARQQGRADAQALCESTTEESTRRKSNADRSYELHSALLAVKARQWQMITDGDSIAAAAYISAFKEYVTQNSPQLAKEIF